MRRKGSRRTWWERNNFKLTLNFTLNGRFPHHWKRRFKLNSFDRQFIWNTILKHCTCSLQIILQFVFRYIRTLFVTTSHLFCTWSRGHLLWQSTGHHHGLVEALTVAKFTDDAFSGANVQNRLLTVGACVGAVLWKGNIERNDLNLYLLAECEQKLMFDEGEFTKQTKIENFRTN